MRKLTRTQMRPWLRAQLAKQGGVCPLCQLPIDLSVPREGVIDHDHETGECRGVLHRSCNAALGKADHAVARWGCKSHSYEKIIPWLERMLEYYRQPGLGVMYPGHKTEEEKRLAANAKRRKTRAAGTAKRQVRSMAPKTTQKDSE